MWIFRTTATGARSPRRPSSGSLRGSTAPPPGRATGLLAPYLESRNRYLRGLAAEALRRLRTPAATELLLDWLTVARWCPITTPDSPF